MKLFLPRGVSTRTALYNSAGVDAMFIEAISGNLPNG